MIICRGILAAVIFSTLLSACGGGGASTASSSTTASLAACNAFNAPSNTALDYAGKRNPVELDETTSQPMTAAIFQLATDLDEIKKVLPTPFVDPTPYCGQPHYNNGGSESTLQFMNTDGSGWAYRDYHSALYDNGYELDTLNGVVYATFQPLDSADNRIQSTIHFDGVRESIHGVKDLTYNGTLIVTYAVIAVSAQGEKQYSPITPVSASLTIEDNKSKAFTMAQDFRYADTDASLDFWSRTITGDVYISNLGYVQVNTQTPLGFIPTIVTAAKYGSAAVQGGPLKVTGGGSAVTYVEPISESHYAIALDNDGDGILDESARASWSTFALDSSTSPDLAGPVPVASITRLAEVGKATSLNALGSYGAAGGYTTFSWQLLYSPPGSAAALTTAAAASPMPGFVPDKIGEYLFRLTASDGVKTNATDYVLWVPDQGSVFFGSMNSDYFLDPAGPDLHVNVGQEVVLDSSDSNAYSEPYWLLNRPAGSSAQLTVADGGQDPSSASFTPDVSGIYVAVLYDFAVSEGGGAPDTYQVIAAGTNTHFDPPVGLDESQTGKFFTVGDFNNDGHADVAELVYLGFTAVYEVKVFYGDGTGHFSTPTTISIGNLSDVTQMIGGDANNDGLADIVLNNAYGATVLLQQRDGTLASPQLVQFSHSATSCVTNALSLVDIAPWKGNLTNSLMMESECEANVNVADAGAGNTYSITASPAIPNVANSGDVAMRMADMSGDAIADLVMYNWSTSFLTSSYELNIFSGNSDGSFNSPISLPLSGVDPGNGGGSPTFVLDDLNGDGLNDLAVVGGGNLDVFLQTSSHGFGSPVQYPIMVQSPLSTGEEDISSADINGDGREDLLVSYPEVYNYNAVSSEVYGSVTGLVDFVGISLQNSSNTFDSQMLYPIGVGPETWRVGHTHLSAADLNGDGLPDLILLDDNGNLKILFQVPLP